MALSTAGLLHCRQTTAKMSAHVAVAEADGAVTGTWHNPEESDENVANAYHGMARLAREVGALQQRLGEMEAALQKTSSEATSAHHA